MLRADVTDLARPQAQAAWGSRWQCRAAELRRLLDLAGVPVPEELAAPPGIAGSADVTGLLSRLDPDSTGRWAAAGRSASPATCAPPGRWSGCTSRERAGDPRWAAGRTELCRALSRIASQMGRADPEQEAWLVSLAAYDDAFLRATAIRSLAGLGGHEQLIITALSDDSPLVAGAALDSVDSAEGLAAPLAQIAGRLEPRLDLAAPPRGEAAGQGRGSRRPGGACPGDGRRRDGPGRRVINSVLAWEDHRSVIPVLSDQVRSGARGRAAAAYLLGELRAGGTAGDLITALAQDPADVQFRVACIEALGKLADPAAVPVLTAQAGHRYP